MPPSIIPVELAMNRRRTFLVLIVAAALVGAGLYVAWDQYWRPWTVRDLLEAKGLRAGMVRDLEGTITAVHALNTSLGPAIGIELDGNRTCARGVVLGDPAVTYRVGERFRTTLHFREYSFNGQPGVWAPEILCPFLGLVVEEIIVLDNVSNLKGAVMRVVSPQAAGWTGLEFVHTNGTRVPQNLSASLRAGLPLGDDPVTGRPFNIDSAGNWITAAAVEYVAMTAFYATHPELDRMDSLAAAASERGMIRFVDSQSDGLVGVGDRIEVGLNTTGGVGRYQMFALVLLDVDSQQPWAVKFILHGPEGSIEAFAG